MFKIDKRDNSIELTRGDSAVIELFLTSYFDKGSPRKYDIQPDDSITLSVRTARVNGERLVFEKQIIENSFFHIEPRDTKCLRCGTYYYDVQVKTADGDVFTVIAPTVFKILPEVNIDD